MHALCSNIKHTHTVHTHFLFLSSYYRTNLNKRNEIKRPAVAHVMYKYITFVTIKRQQFK